MSPPPPPHPPKKNSGSVPVTLTEIVGPQMWTTPSYKFYIKRRKKFTRPVKQQKNQHFLGQPSSQLGHYHLA